MTPDGLDMLSVCAEAGLGFDQALQRLSENWNSALALEFGRVVAEMQMGVQRQTALRNLADRTGVVELASFVAVIIQSDQLGMSIDEHALLRIEQHRVVLQLAGAAACDVAMFAPRPTPAPTGPVLEGREPRSGAPAPEHGVPGIPVAALDEGITSTGVSSWTIHRDLVDRLLASQPTLMTLARAVPLEEDGRVVGVRVYGIARTGVLGRLGVRNGDLLRTLNGFQLGAADEALAAYTDLRTADRLSLTLVRAGTPLTLDYRIE